MVESKSGFITDYSENYLGGRLSDLFLQVSPLQTRNRNNQTDGGSGSR